MSEYEKLLDDANDQIKGLLDRVAELEAELNEQCRGKMAAEGQIRKAAESFDAILKAEREWREKLQAENERLRGIVERMPKWADGTVAGLGDTGWKVSVGPRGGVSVVSHQVGWDEDERRITMGQYWVGRAADGDPLTYETCGEVSDYYATREAAEAAKEARDGD